jgi:acetylornithine deacetylase/succinyl-diaminopimelate desuccinylase-like protein
MAEAGLDVRTVAVPPDLLPRLAPHGMGLPRPSVIGRLPGAGDRPLLHFTGHYDVVPAGGGWSVDPYGGEIRGGNLYGRGASDQKSGIAAQIFALKALRKTGLPLAGTILSSATPDEETGGFAGLGYLVERGIVSRDNTDFCVITECLGVDSICLGHRGTLWLELETRGRQCHGSTVWNCRTGKSDARTTDALAWSWLGLGWPARRHLYWTGLRLWRWLRVRWMRRRAQYVREPLGLGWSGFRPLSVESRLLIAGR